MTPPANRKSPTMDAGVQTSGSLARPRGGGGGGFSRDNHRDNRERFVGSADNRDVYNRGGENRGGDGVNNRDSYNRGDGSNRDGYNRGEGRDGGGQRRYQSQSATTYSNSRPAGDRGQSRGGPRGATRGKTVTTRSVVYIVIFFIFI